MRSLLRWTPLLAFFSTLHLTGQALAGVSDKRDVDFPNEGRLAILYKVADLFELNLVIASGFPGKEEISVKLRDATWRQACEACLSGTGRIGVARGNVIWIVPPDNPIEQFGEMRDRLDRETDRTQRLREVIAFLTRPKASALTKVQQAQLRAFLDAPEDSAADLLAHFVPTPGVPGQEPGGMDDTVSVDFPDDGRLTILRAVAELFEVTIVNANGFPDEGKIAIKLRDITWRRFFETCLIGSGYIYVARGNRVWLVRADGQLGELGEMRNRLEMETAETKRLREVIAILARPKGRLTKVQRAEIRAFLDAPESSAADLLKKLTPGRAK